MANPYDVVDSDIGSGGDFADVASWIAAFNTTTVEQEIGTIIAGTTITDTDAAVFISGSLKHVTLQAASGGGVTWDPGTGTAVAQYAEAVINGKDNAQKVEAATGGIAFNSGNRLQRHKPRSKARQGFDAGKAAMGMGDYEKAMGQFAEVIRLDPDFAQAHYRMGLIHVHTGNAALARREWTTLKKLDPDLANLLGQLIKSD